MCIPIPSEFIGCLETFNSLIVTFGGQRFFGLLNLGWGWFPFERR